MIIDKKDRSLSNLWFINIGTRTKISSIVKIKKLHKNFLFFLFLSIMIHGKIIIEKSVHFSHYMYLLEVFKSIKNTDKLTTLGDSTSHCYISVFSVHVVGTTSRVVSDPNSEVFYCCWTFVKHLHNNSKLLMIHLQQTQLTQICS